MDVIDNLNKLVGKAYDVVDYHCYHLIEEAVPNAPKLDMVNVATAEFDVIDYKHLFKPIRKPKEGRCIVLLGKEHIGIYDADIGYIMHNDSRTGTGVRWESYHNMVRKYNDELNYFTV